MTGGSACAFAGAAVRAGGVVERLVTLSDASAVEPRLAAELAGSSADGACESEGMGHINSRNRRVPTSRDDDEAFVVALREKIDKNAR